MSVILITGQPGGGKTALCVDMLAHDEQFKGRPLFVMGIPELTLDHSVCPPGNEWTELRPCPEDESKDLAYFTFPENALVVIDEAQRIYRPRAVGSKVPPEVAAFETHRHTGIDFILLTQHAGLIDSNIRKLIGRHIHIRVTPLGRYKYQWTELGDPESTSSRDIAAKERYKLPARAFDLYKSSQKHTKIKTKMPWFVWVFGIAFLMSIALGFYTYQRITAKIEPKSKTETLAKDSPRSTTGQNDGVQSPSEYFASLSPRQQGLHHTAPRYDEITKPTDAPWPVGCIQRAAWRDKPAGCRCIDQQGNNYNTSDAQCRSIVKNGIFKDWGETAQPQRDTPQAGRQEAVAAASIPNSTPPQAQHAAPPAAPPVQPVVENPRPIPADSKWRYKS